MEDKQCFNRCITLRYMHHYNQFKESNHDQFLIIDELREIFFGCMCSVPNDSDFHDVLTTVLNQATTTTQLDLKSFDGIIYCWLKSVGLVYTRCNSKQLKELYRRFVLCFIAIIKDEIINPFVKRVVLEDWIEHLINMSAGVKKRVFLKLRNNFKALLREDLKLIGNFHLQTLVVEIIHSYIKILGDEKKQEIYGDFLTNIVPPVADGIDYGSYLKFYFTSLNLNRYYEWNCRMFLNHYNHLLGPRVHSIEAVVVYINMYEVQKQRFSKNCEQIWIDFNSPEFSIEFYGEVSDSQNSETAELALYELDYENIVKIEPMFMEFQIQLRIFLSNNIRVSNKELGIKYRNCRNVNIIFVNNNMNSYLVNSFLTRMCYVLSTDGRHLTQVRDDSGLSNGSIPM